MIFLVIWSRSAVGISSSNATLPLGVGVGDALGDAETVETGLDASSWAAYGMGEMGAVRPPSTREVSLWFWRKRKPIAMRVMKEKMIKIAVPALPLFIWPTLLHEEV